MNGWDIALIVVCTIGTLFQFGCIYEDYKQKKKGYIALDVLQILLYVLAIVCSLFRR